MNLPSLVLGHCPAESLREIIFYLGFAKKLAVQMFFFIFGALRASGIAPGDYFFILVCENNSPFRCFSLS